MNQDNPYASPSETPHPHGVDPQLLIEIASALANSRKNPPTIRGALLKFPGTLGLILVGVAGTAILVLLTGGNGNALTSHWPLGFGAMMFGAFLRDLSSARRYKKLWSAESHFIDWKKVDEFTA